VTAQELAGPGGETRSAPAFSVPEFSLRYHLDWRDALVWETLPSELSGRQKAVYLAFPVAGGMAYGLANDSLPAWVTATPAIFNMLAIVAVMHGLWIIFHNRQKRAAARRRLPHPISCTLEDWGDNIYLCSDLEEVALSTGLCRQTVVTPTHAFIDFPGTLAIVPATAFDSAAQRDAFVGKWQRHADEARD
jgi:hypothetical protein